MCCSEIAHNFKETLQEDWKTTASLVPKNPEALITEKKILGLKIAE